MGLQRGHVLQLAPHLDVLEPVEGKVDALVELEAAKGGAALPVRVDLGQKESEEEGEEEADSRLSPHTLKRYAGMAATSVRMASGMWERR